MVEESEVRAFKNLFLITKGNFLYSRSKTRDSVNYFDINQVLWSPLSSTDGVEYNPTG